MISAEKVNEKFENKLSKKDREELTNKVSEICVGSGGYTSNIKKAKKILNCIFNKENPLLDINLPITKMGNTSYTPLLLATWFDKRDIINELIDLGAKIDNESFNLLHVALSKADIKVIDKFLTLNPNLINITSETGVNALMIASETGKKEVVKLLIEKYQVNIHLKDNDGKTCLDHARERNQKDVEAFLMYYYLNSQLNNKETKSKVAKL